MLLKKTKIRMANYSLTNDWITLGTGFPNLFDQINTLYVNQNLKVLMSMTKHTRCSCSVIQVYV